ncbi:MAG: DUF2490 domain-containing protein [Flavobacteriaceae bacterium]
MSNIIDISTFKQTLKHLALVAMCFSSLSSIHAQSTSQLWLDVNPSYEQENNLIYYGDLGYRVDFSKDNWNRFVVRPGVKKTFKHYYLTTGVGNFITLENSEDGQDIYELRPFQGIGTNWPNTQYFKLNHYVRFEEQMAWNTTENNFDFTFRVRYKFTFSYSYRTWLENHHNWWKTYLSFELFGATSDASNSIGEQSRLSLGIERSFNRNQKVRIETTWQKQQIFFKPSAPINAFYLRLRYYPNWGKGLKKKPTQK